MKRCIVFLLLLALPIRTVLAISGFGCTMMPMQIPMEMPMEMPPQTDGVPCPMHAANGASTAETPADGGSAACSSCAAACCAGLAPMSTDIAGGSLAAGDHAPAVVKTSFANAVPHTLERPPRFT